MRCVMSFYASALLLASLAGIGSAAPPDPAKDPTGRMSPFPAFRIADNFYYVGSRGLASYLIVTPQGDILINPSYVQSVPMIQQSIESLGFKFTDIKILLISHAHDDHDAGAAAVIAATHAQYMVMDADVPVVESGGKTDFFYNKPNQFYPPAKVDRILHDGDTVKLGSFVLTAHKTPGHTRGNTTWTLPVTDKGQKLNAVIVGSWNVNAGFRLVDNKPYPEIRQDYEKTFRVLKSLPCDIFLGAHGDYFGMEAKYARMKQGDANAWIDPQGYKTTVAAKEELFRKELKRQQEGGK